MRHTPPNNGIVYVSRPRSEPRGIKTAIRLNATERDALAALAALPDGRRRSLSAVISDLIRKAAAHAA